MESIVGENGFGLKVASKINHNSPDNKEYISYKGEMAELVMAPG